jgi:hypothetical protein
MSGPTVFSDQTSRHLRQRAEEYRALAPAQATSKLRTKMLLLADHFEALAMGLGKPEALSEAQSALAVAGRPPDDDQ